MIKALVTAGFALFAGLLGVNHWSQQKLCGFFSPLDGITVAECNEVDSDTATYCTATAATTCAQVTSFQNLTCSGGTSSLWGPLNTGCSVPNARTACTTHRGAKLATESGNYKLVDGAAGSCGTYSGNRCKTTPNAQTWPCGHPGHSGKTVSFTHQNCGDDPNNPFSDNCAGVVKNADAC